MIIDFKNSLNNDFRVFSELTFKREQKWFRPDIIVLINGVPLGFIGTQKPIIKKMEYGLNSKE